MDIYREPIAAGKSTRATAALVGAPRATATRKLRIQTPAIRRGPSNRLTDVERSRAIPELVATAPGQVYSWDITKLAGPIKGTYFDCYVILDIYSRYIIGAHVNDYESGELAVI